MATGEWLVDQFEEHRAHLRTVAYRMLGSASEAEDAVQETWIRLSRTDVGGVASLRRWLTTVVARVCLDMLRARTSRREAPLDARLPDPIITRGAWEPESEALLADAVGLALLIVLDTLEPAERLAFVLHDVFGMTFDEIAPIVDRSPVAARQLASRARRRVQRNAPSPDRDLRQQRRVVEAFLAAVREGRVEHLVALLDPDVVLRADGGARAGASRVLRGAQAVAGQAATFSKVGLSDQIVLVNGNVGLLERRPDGRLFAVIGFTIASGRIAEMNILADPERLGSIPRRSNVRECDLRRAPMKIKLTRVHVDDQEKALRFYTEVLGFVKKADFTQGPFRWLTVASPEDPDGTELQLALNGTPAAKAYQQAMFQQGQPAAMFLTDDVQADYERMKARGAEFTTPLTDVTASKIAMLDDTCGNLIQVTQLIRW
jgi:RNA polymerase sigma-70 factor, ECF subfamily